jgi:hypothetical protein
MIFYRDEDNKRLKGRFLDLDNVKKRKDKENVIITHIDIFITG